MSIFQNTPISRAIFGRNSSLIERAPKTGPNNRESSRIPIFQNTPISRAIFGRDSSLLERGPKSDSTRPDYVKPKAPFETPLTKSIGVPKLEDIRLPPAQHNFINDPKKPIDARLKAVSTGLKNIESRITRTHKNFGAISDHMSRMDDRVTKIVAHMNKEATKQDANQRFRDKTQAGRREFGDDYRRNMPTTKESPKPVAVPNQDQNSDLTTNLALGAAVLAIIKRAYPVLAVISAAYTGYIYRKEIYEAGKNFVMPRNPDKTAKQQEKDDKFLNKMQGNADPETGKKWGATTEELREGLKRRSEEKKAEAAAAKELWDKRYDRAKQIEAEKERKKEERRPTRITVDKNPETPEIEKKLDDYYGENKKPGVDVKAMSEWAKGDKTFRSLGDDDDDDMPPLPGMLNRKGKRKRGSKARVIPPLPLPMHHRKAPPKGLNPYTEGKSYDQTANFLKFGALPPGFEHVAGNRGILGKPVAVAASGAQPFGGGSMGSSYDTGGGSNSGGSNDGSIQHSTGYNVGGGEMPSPVYSGSLLEIRQQQAEYLKNNPEARKGLLIRAEIEVGSQPKAQQIWIESALNRAAANKIDIFAAVNNNRKHSYYPKKDDARFNRMMAQDQSSLEKKYKHLLDDEILAKGSNSSQYATDNASSGLAKRKYARDKARGRPGIWKDGEYFGSDKGARGDWSAAQEKVDKEHALSNKKPTRVSIDREPLKPAEQKLLDEYDARAAQKSGSGTGSGTGGKQNTSQPTIESGEKQYPPHVSSGKIPSLDELAQQSMQDPAKHLGGKLNVVNSNIPGYGGKGGPPKKYDYIGVHYTYGDSLSSAVNTAKNTNVGYQYLIDKDGTVHEVANTKEKYSNHWGNNNVHTAAGNRNSIGISYVGKPGNATKNQVLAGLQLIERERKKHNIPVKNVLGHGEATRNHRSNSEGYDILLPFRQMHGIKDPDIALASGARDEWYKKWKYKVGEPGENLPQYIKDAMQKAEKDMSEGPVQTEKQLEAHTQLQQMRKSGELPVAAPKATPAPPVDFSQISLKDAAARQTAPNRIGQFANMQPTPTVTEAPAPKDAPKSERDAIIDGMENESAMEREKLSKERAAAPPSGGGDKGSSGSASSGGGRTRNNPEQEPPRPGSSGYGNAGRCWV